MPFESEPTFRIASEGLAYDFADSALSGGLTATTMRPVTFGVEGGTQVQIAEGASAIGQIENNAIQRIDGGIPFSIQDPVGPVGEGSLGFEMPEGQDSLNAEATFTLSAPYGFPDRSSTTAFFKEGSTVSMTMTEGAMDTASVENLAFTVLNPSAEGQGQLDGTIGGSLDFETGMVQAEGAAALVSDWPLPVEWGEFVLTEGGNINVGIVESQISQMSGDIPFSGKVNSAATTTPIEFAGNVSGAFNREEGTVEGAAEATLEGPVQVPLANGDEFHVNEGQVSAQMSGSVGMATLGMEASSQYIRQGQPFLGIEFIGEYQNENQTFSGEGQAQLLQREVIAENVAVGDDAYSFFLEPDTRVNASMEDNVLTDLQGTLVSTVEDESGQFMRATTEGSYPLGEEDASIAIKGAVEITREKLLDEGEEYNVSLSPGTGAEIEYENEQFSKLGGSITTKVDRVGGDGPQGEFAKITMEGEWTPDAGFNGRGAAELMSEFTAGELGEYTMVVEPGAGAEVALANSEVTHIGGTIPVRMDEGDLQFIRGNLSGDYVVESEAFSGAGSAEIITEKQLAELGEDQFWLKPGSGAAVTVTDNELTEIGGQVNLALRDGEGEYIEVNFGGNFDAAGGTGFSGGGGATVSREKKLGEFGDYSFFLEPGTGATAEVEQNDLTKVGGNVPFRVNDGQGPLLAGHAEGEYMAETGMFSGIGMVELARDVTYDAPGGITLDFLAGSGGSGEVEENELNRLEGTLKVRIGNEDGPLIYLEAQGGYDAVEQNIESLEGQMELLRPMSVLGDNMVIENVNGSAKVEDNELKEASGGGTVRLPALNDMEGTFNVNYANEGGTEEYWGDGQLNFTLFDDPQQGRSMSGLIGAELKRGGGFAVDGMVDYQLNEMIGGAVGVSMDENLDPVIDATLGVDTTLVPGSELFRQEMDLIPRQQIPIYGPIALFFGAKGGMGLDMMPLNMQASIGVSNWHPLAQEAHVPEFEADLGLSWGMNFDAKAAAYMSLGLTVGVASASAGLRGEAGLDVPLTIEPTGHLHGGPDGYYGELGVGVAIRPTLDLSVVPFVDAAITGIDPFTHDFEGIDMQLANIADFEWGTSYTFGDREEQSNAAPAPVEAAGSASQNTATAHTEEPNLGGANMGSSVQAPGGPALGGQDVEANEEAGGQDSAMGELMDTIDKIKVMAEGIGALGGLVGLVISLVTAFLTFGPVGLIVMAVWKIFTGELSWDSIVEKIDAVVAALETAAELLQPYLPEWMQPIVDAFSGEKPGLLDAMFGADDEMRASVGRGEHRYANAQFRSEMINAMMDGACLSEDESCIATVLEHSDSVGDFKTVVRGCEGGADRIMDKLSWGREDRVEVLMNRHGISFDTGW